MFGRPVEYPIFSLKIISRRQKKKQKILLAIRSPFARSVFEAKMHKICFRPGLYFIQILLQSLRCFLNLLVGKGRYFSHPPTRYLRRPVLKSAYGFQNHIVSVSHFQLIIYWFVSCLFKSVKELVTANKLCYDMFCNP